jgi:hypothetical protein
MIGQQHINSFFSPVSKKRVSKELGKTEKHAEEVQVSVFIYLFFMLSILVTLMLFDVIHVIHCIFESNKSTVLLC